VKAIRYYIFKGRKHYKNIFRDEHQKEEVWERYAGQATPTHLKTVLHIRQLLCEHMTIAEKI
jgi:hypothetical protein